MTREGLFYHIMVDMDERPKGWNKELYDTLSFEYLIECATKIDGIKEWNLVYQAYLKSEWKRLFPRRKFDENHYVVLFDDNSKFVRPNFADRNFNAAIENGASFLFARFDGADFYRSHLEGATFDEAYLRGADFAHAYLNESRFDNSHAGGANFYYAHLEKASFWLAYLGGASFSHASLIGTDFSEAELYETIFYCAHLEGVNFDEAFLDGAMFNYAMVNGETMFSDNTINDKTDFTGTHLSLARIEPNLRKQLERNIRKLNITNKNVFVAMKFDSPDLDSALKNAIKPACQECGELKACTVNEKAGDGWIPQRIKEEIQDARFVISDLTYRNPGVYYETGYADGLEIPVIQTCKRSWYDEEPAALHFDIAQRNTIFWKDNDDLKQQLIMKIKELQEIGK